MERMNQTHFCHVCKEEFLVLHSTQHCETEKHKRLKKMLDRRLAAEHREMENALEAFKVKGLWDQISPDGVPEELQGLKPPQNWKKNFYEPSARRIFPPVPRHPYYSDEEEDSAEYNSEQWNREPDRDDHRRPSRSYYGDKRSNATYEKLPSYGHYGGEYADYDDYEDLIIKRELEDEGVEHLGVNW